jgi:hypothetical protein
VQAFNAILAEKNDSMQVKDIVDNAVFWEDLQHGTQLYQPFSDYIHQLEGDSPGLGRVYHGLMQFSTFVPAWSNGARSHASQAAVTHCSRHGKGDLATATAPAAQCNHSCSCHKLQPTSSILCRQSSLQGQHLHPQQWQQRMRQQRAHSLSV